MSHYRGQCNPDDPPVLLLVRFGCSLTGRARNSLIKNLPVHNNYTGGVVGMGDEVKVLEGHDWPRHRSIAVLRFECMCEAEKWYNCTPEIKQPDWLEGVDMIAVPLRNKECGTTKPIFQVLDLKFKDKSAFLSKYVPQVAKYLEGKDVDVGVVATDKIVKLRGLWDPDYMVINQFASPEVFSNSYYADEYKPIKQCRDECADTTAIVTPLKNLFLNRE